MTVVAPELPSDGLAALRAVVSDCTVTNSLAPERAPAAAAVHTWIASTTPPTVRAYRSARRSAA
ncbi:hypothetical protein STPH2_1487 [Streptomyces sp. KO7888]|nr:hypothetical protein [Streptomyces sp. KO7888]